VGLPSILVALTITRAILNIYQRHFLKEEIVSNHISVISSFGLLI